LEQSSDQLGIFATVALFHLTHEIYDHILPISRTPFRLQRLFLIRRRACTIMPPSPRRRCQENILMSALPNDQRPVTCWLM